MSALEHQNGLRVPKAVHLQLAVKAFAGVEVVDWHRLAHKCQIVRHWHRVGNLTDGELVRRLEKPHHGKRHSGRNQR